MDDIDKLQQHDEILHRAHLQQSGRDTGDAIAAGACLFCEAPLPPNIRWCGAECRDDWQKRRDKE